VISSFVKAVSNVYLYNNTCIVNALVLSDGTIKPATAFTDVVASLANQPNNAAPVTSETGHIRKKAMRAQLHITRSFNLMTSDGRCAGGW
jgi:hypothetical protein